MDAPARSAVSVALAAGLVVGQPSAAASIPSAAWSRPIGAPMPSAGRRAADQPHLIDDGPHQGLPIGGLGSGAIGRTHRGDFARWHLDVGRHRYATAWANQFSIFVEHGGLRSARVLSTARPTEVLQDWNWDLAEGSGTYHALFPRAWFTYDDLPVRVRQEQFSPVIPGNYKESSYPVGVFEFVVENPTLEPARVGLMLTWQDAVRLQHRFVDGGIELGGSDGTFAIAAGVAPGGQLSTRSFVVDASGADLWQDFASDGQLRPSGNAGDSPAVSGNAGDAAAMSGNAGDAAAVAVTFELAPGESRVVPFAIAWDLPTVTFPGGTSWYKRHTRFYGRDGHNALRMASDALVQYPAWREAIVAWQQPIVADPARPEWYKTALFNELYYLVDGGTLWFESPEHEEGLFAYLESYDYPFYATHDVAFYSSWAVLELWPKLERREMLLFAETVAEEDLTPVRVKATRQMAARKRAGSLPHDLGAPFEDPFVRTNAYKWQDVTVWKDLNLKYVLRAYRDYVVLQDRDFLDAVWPTIPVALEYVRGFDADGDGLLDHFGADQTYDTWSMLGASAYTAGLLIAALEAASEMARVQGRPDLVERYVEWLGLARQSVQDKLWNGRYFRYNTGQNPQRESSLADQLAGQWYTGALGLPGVAPREQVVSALKSVFELNVMQFGGGELGAVNGMQPDGRPDETDMQSREVWSGVTYALAAMMLQEGLDREAWQTAWGAYHVTYVTGGFWFRTPEAWTADLSFRASMYMRPQSIWAIEHALRLRRDGV